VDVIQKILIYAVALLPAVISMVMVIRVLIDNRRHSRVMALIRQADDITKQFRKAINKGDGQSAEFHLERHKELCEMIDREIKRK
jgi:hypothetical protein